ncbi:unnamed protein product [Phytophthora lilii]|uniref:Unnamed protein product n=1 Tax=Phytophthora lilii TaxID=2077276 RepID=A0A9W6WWL1_9STRA|nr:unnamed protein product [Phytophthora lilii]
MFAARAAANRKVADAKRAREASEWNVAHDIEHPEKGGEGEANPEVSSPPLIEEGDAVEGQNKPNTSPRPTSDKPAEPNSGSTENTKEEESDLIRLIPLTGLTGFRLYYVRLSNVAISTLNNTWFNSVVMLCISWASLSVGLQTYPVLGESVILNDIDFFVLAIMDINYFGCDRFNGGYYSTDPAAAASFQYCNATRVYGANVTESSLASQRALNQVMASLYFITFILISAFVMLSLFIGAITMSMTQSMEHMKKAQEEVEAKKRAEKARKRALEAERRAREAEKKRAGGIGEQDSNELDPNKKGKLSAAERRERQKMREVLMQTWDDCDLTDILTQQQGDTRSLKGAYLKLAGVATKVVEHPKFSLFVTGVIILAGLMVGLQTSQEVIDVLGAVLNALDTAILVVFTAEVILKIIAEGLEPWQYFRTAWNVFDFIIVVGSFTRGTGGMLTMLRLLRLLRVLKLVRAFPQLQVIVSALIKGVGSIGYIGLILLLCFYVFGIVGNMLFADNDPFHFQYLHFAMISLFQLATMDGWSDVLYINYYGCDLYGYDDYRALGYECKNEPSGLLAVAYFCSFIVLGAMVLITLFIGVVTTSMEEATQEMEAEKELLRRVEALRELHNIDSKVVSSYMQVFRMLDLDGSGSVEEAELRTGLAAIGKYPSYEELKEMMDVVDEDGSGQIDIVEFVEFMIHVREKSNQQHAARLAAEAAEAAELAAAEAEERAAAARSITTDAGSLEASNGVVASPTVEAAKRKSVSGTEDIVLGQSNDGDEESDARVLAINTTTDEVDETGNVASIKTPSRSWSSPRPSLSSRNVPGCNVMPYLSDKEFQDTNTDHDTLQAKSSGAIPIQIETTSDEGSDTALLPQVASLRPRSGRVTSKILPSG